MPKVKTVSSSTPSKEIRRPINPENAEAQCVALAMDLARKRLIEGTASAQEVTYFLKLGNQEAKLKLEMLEVERELAKAKADKIKSEERSEKMYADAIAAMRDYQGYGDPDEY